MQKGPVNLVHYHLVDEVYFIFIGEKSILNLFS